MNKRTLSIFARNKAMQRSRRKAQWQLAIGLTAISTILIITANQFPMGL